MAELKSVLLVPVDDTEVSEKVVDYAVKQIYRSGDEVRILHIIPTPMPEYIAGGVDVLFTMPPDPREDVKHIEDAKAFIRRRFVPKMEESKVPYKVEIVHFLTDEDSIGEAICKRADRLQPRAVIMAKHQRGRIKEFFLGSAAKYVVTHCKWPVVVLHEEAMGGSTTHAPPPAAQLHEA